MSAGETSSAAAAAANPARSGSYSYNYYDTRLRAVEQRQGSLDQRHADLDQRHTVTSTLLNRLTNGVNLMIVSLNRVGETVLQGTMRMTDGIGNALDAYAGKLRKLSQAGAAPEDTLLNERHVRFLNRLRRERPAAYAAMLTVARQIPDLPTDQARDTLLYYFDPEAGAGTTGAGAAGGAVGGQAAQQVRRHPRSVTTLRYFGPPQAAPA
jgi:hypothetical protein